MFCDLVDSTAPSQASSIRKTCARLCGLIKLLAPQSSSTLTGPSPSIWVMAYWSILAIRKPTKTMPNGPSGGTGYH